MNNGWRIIGIVAAFLLVFVFGAILGGSGMVLYSRGRWQAARAEHEREAAEMRARQAELREQQSRTVDALKARIAELQAQVNANPRRLPAPEQFGPRLMQRFVNQLQPTPEQRAKIQPMVNQTAEELRRLRRDTGHKAELAIEQLEDRISTVLTPEQRDRFNDLIQRWRDAFDRFNKMQQERQAEQRLREQQGREQRKNLKLPPAPAPAGPAVAPGPGS